MIELVSFYDPNVENRVDFRKMTKEEMKQYFLEGLDKENLSSEEYKKSVADIEKKVKMLRGENSLSYNKEFTTKEKVLWAKALKNGNNPYYEYILTNIIDQNIPNIQMKTYKEAIEYIKKTDLTFLFGMEIKGLGKNFACGIIDGNVANINQDKDGNWKYFTRDKASSDRYAFDAIDVMEIINNVGYYEALNMLCEMLKIEVEEGKWVMNQHVKYSKNTGKIINADEDMAIRYPALYKYINKHLYVLKEMNANGSANVLVEEDSVDGEAVFFASSRYIADKLEKQGIKKSHTNINKVINMFTVLGLINKIDIKKVPNNLKEHARKFERTKAREVVKYNVEGNKNCHTISFYQIPFMATEVLMEAERRVMLLKQSKIKATGISVTNDEVKKALGEDIFYLTIGHNELFAKRIEQAKIEAEEDKKSLPF